MYFHLFHRQKDASDKERGVKEQVGHDSVKESVIQHVGEVDTDL